jgi:hypothetical protein
LFELTCRTGQATDGTQDRPTHHGADRDEKENAQAVIPDDEPPKARTHESPNRSGGFGHDDIPVLVGLDPDPICFTPSSLDQDPSPKATSSRESKG